MSEGPLLLALLAAALKAGLLLVLAAGLAAALRRAPARTRHGVWAGSLIGALLVPALAPWVPDWTIAALPAPALAVERPAVERLAARRQELAPAAPTVEITASTTGSRPLRGAATQVTGSAGWATRLSPAAWLLIAWLAGCAAGLGWLLRALLAARRLTLGGRQAARPWRQELALARNRVGVRRPVRLLHSAAVARPVTWGWLRPVILLPEAARSWGGERRRIVLWHELVHVRRGDWLVRLVAQSVCSVYWFNPLAWLAARRLALEQEIACDEEVVALGTRPSSYAGHLLAIARSLGPAPAHALDMARRSQMEGRLMSILDGRRLRGGRKLAIPALLLIAGLVPALAAIEPWVEGQERVAGAGSEVSVVATGEAAAVARVLGELEELERRMEPLEVELEGLELEMEPIAEELEGLEVEMEPVEVELAAFETELEPFEAELEAVASEMEPHEIRLEEFEAELEPFEERLEALEQEMEPFHEQLEEMASELDPYAMSELHTRLEPMYERLQAIHQEMEPIFERLNLAHREMRPLHERMSEIHRRMEPVYQRMGEAHERMRPFHERLGERHRRMEPHHRKMGEIHERMRPLHEEMAQHHQQLERELAAMVERMLARQLADVTAADTDYAPVAARLVDELSWRVNDGTLWVRGSAPQLRELLREALADSRVGGDQEFADAVARVTRDILELQVRAPGASGS